ncbi:MAG: hypothetical protein WAV20_15140 [Blastocatellia bacterium]
MAIISVCFIAQQRTNTVTDYSFKRFQDGRITLKMGGIQRKAKLLCYRFVFSWAMRIPCDLAVHVLDAPSCQSCLKRYLPELGTLAPGIGANVNQGFHASFGKHVTELLK